MLRIIDHKRIDLTDDEYTMYEDLCARYDNPPSIKGSDLFANLFLTNDEGIITYLLPPTRQTSFEVVFFLQNIMQHQHLRLIHAQIDTVCKKVEDELVKLKEITEVKK